MKFIIYRGARGGRGDGNRGASPSVFSVLSAVKIPPAVKFEIYHGARRGRGDGNRGASPSVFSALSAVKIPPAAKFEIYHGARRGRGDGNRGASPSVFSVVKFPRCTLKILRLIPQNVIRKNESCHRVNDRNGAWKNAWVVATRCLKLHRFPFKGNRILLL